MCLIVDIKFLLLFFSLFFFIFLFFIFYIAWFLKNVEKGISFLNLYFDLNFLHLFKGALKNMFNFQNFLF